MPKSLLPLLILILSACLPIVPASPQADIERGEPLFRDEFVSAGGWDTRNQEGLTIGIEDEAYTMLLSQAGSYVWGVDYNTQADSIIETEVIFRSDYPRTFAGVMCRADGDGRGYAFLISADGAFSIRRSGQNELVPLVEWQNHRAITGNRNTIRVICAGEYLALYANDRFLASVRDDFYSDGYTGLMLGLPPTAGANNPANVQFSYVEAWEVGE